MKRQSGIALVALGSAILVAGGVHVATIRDMNRERRARRYLGDRLYAEVRGGGDRVVFLPGCRG